MSRQTTQKNRLGITAAAWLLAGMALACPLGAAGQDTEEPEAPAPAEAASETDGETAIAPPPPTAPPPAPPTCEGDDHAAFDFWAGEWDVYRWRDEWDLAAWREENPGAELPVNRISKVHQGCALREEYTTPQGYEGSSINFFSRADGQWHQTWIDSTGTALFLSGGIEDGKMILADEPVEGQPHSRITWQPQDDGSVRQTWEQSPDGKAWQVVFDGRYVRRGGSE